MLETNFCTSLVHTRSWREHSAIAEHSHPTKCRLPDSETGRRTARRPKYWFMVFIPFSSSNSTTGYKSHERTVLSGVMIADLAVDLDNSQPEVQASWSVFHQRTFILASPCRHGQSLLSFVPDGDCLSRWTQLLRDVTHLVMLCVSAGLLSLVTGNGALETRLASTGPGISTLVGDLPRRSRPCPRP